MSGSITIVGGGLAGLTLGIGLRQRSVPVSVWEAGSYPRHRVCGEFVSGRGQETLERLGLRELFVKAGAQPASTAAFFSHRNASRVQTLASPALCLSRYIMDELLSCEFVRLGGVLHAGERWREAEFGAGVVRATGRRVQPVVDGWRWYGLKAHAKNVSLAADLEMHLSRSGYVGVCRLADGEVNVCGLFRRPAEGGDVPLRRQEVLCGTPGSLLHQRLANAVFDEKSFSSVAGLSLQPHKGADHNECCIGDTLTMIPPVTGNGMSMAFESAEVAIEPLVNYSEGKISWDEARMTIARRCDERFAKRLAWAARVQSVLLAPGLQGALVSVVPRWDWLWKLLFEKTR